MQLHFQHDLVPVKSVYIPCGGWNRAWSTVPDSRVARSELMIVHSPVQTEIYTITVRYTVTGHIHIRNLVDNGTVLVDEMYLPERDAPEMVGPLLQDLMRLGVALQHGFIPFPAPQRNESLADILYQPRRP